MRQEFQAGARNAVRICLNVSGRDRVAIITDRQSLHIADAIEEEARSTGAEVRRWVMEDFTILRRAESESRESEQRLRTVLDAMPDGVLVLNADGAVVDGNPAAGIVLGLSREAMLMQKEPFMGFTCLNRDNEVVPAESQPHVEALRGSPVHGTTLGLRRDLEGPVRWLRVSATPLPVGPALGLNRARARVVVTFAEPSREEAPSLPALLAAFEALPVEGTPLALQQQILDLGRQMLALTKSAEPHGSAVI